MKEGKLTSKTSVPDAPAGPEGGAAPRVTLVEEQLAWRERTLRGIAWSFAVAGAVCLVWFLRVQPQYPLAPEMAAFAAVSTAVALARRMPFRLRAGALLAVLYLACLRALLFAGFAPNALTGLVMLVVTATLWFGRWFGLFAVAVSTLSILLTSLAHRRAWVVRSPHWSALLDSADGLNALRVAAIAAAGCTTIVIGISYLFERSQQLLVERTRSLALLRTEQLDKERISKDLERREAAFRKARELEILGRLAGSMAHDFNNALLVIWAAMDEIAHAGPLPSAAAIALRDLKAAADQAAATTRQLHAFGPTAPRRPVELDLRPFIERARTMLGRLLPSNIALTAEFETDARLTADEGEVLCVLTNLALNARDAMRDGGKLTFRVRPTRPSEVALAGGRPSVVIEVVDTGCGMTDTVKGRLFEPFFTTKQAAGTGLGLASARDLVTAAGGSVQVESTLDVGTTIALVWPVACGPTATEAGRRVSREPRSAIVLLVDDDDAVRTVVGRRLTRAGMTVIETSDGAAGLVAARRYKQRIDVLCTDCLMPGLPAAELIAEFRALHRGKVLVCSGYTPADTGLTPGVFDDFLSKPFATDELVARIDALLG